MTSSADMATDPGTGRIHYIHHKGKLILEVNFRDLGPDEVKKLSLEVGRVVTAEPKDSMLIIADFSNARLDREAVQVIKEVTARDRPHVRRAAWIVNETFPPSLLKAISDFSVREFPTFPTREAALDFLAQN